MKAALYVRVSGSEQNPDLQDQEVRAYAKRHGFDVVGTYQDVASGAKTRRKGLDRLLTDARKRKFDCVLVWKLDRFGRSFVHCVNCIEELDRYGVRFIAVTQGLDTDQANPAARFLLQVLAAAAEFERSIILERSKAGQARYRRDYEAGKVGRTVNSRSGKNLPPHRPRRVFDRTEVPRLRAKGMSLRKIARELGIGLGTVTRVMDDWNSEQPGCSPRDTEPEG